MRTILTIARVITILATSLDAQAPAIISSTRTPVSTETIGRPYGEMTLTQVATDPEYAFTEKHPVMVTGGFGEGGHNVYRFLNALRGPDAKPVHYSRVGTCCPFETKKSPFGSDLLEVFDVWVEGGTPRRMYFNWYDDGDILVPVGFSAAK